MNRTTKYRGRCANTGEWIYGDLIHDCNGKTFISVTGYSALGTGFNCKYSVDPDTVGQFTGLHDKNGREIYEGDIVWEYITSQIVCSRVVRYYNAAFIADSFIKGGETSAQNYGYVHERYQTLKYFVDTNIKLEVIGNIHDNPELLKTK